MKKILIQFDTDPHASSFDRVVTVDSGVDELFSYAGITTENVEPLVHGAMFTRGPGDLKNTAIFIGGSDVHSGEALLKKVLKTFFGPVRASVMMDCNGSNTTAAAAVLSAAKHLTLSESTALVLGGTGPVGHRVAQLLALEGATVKIGSRSVERADQTCRLVSEVIQNAKVEPCATATDEESRAACDGVQLIVAAGAAGVQFLEESQWSNCDELKVAIDLNAVSPTGLGGIEITDKAVEKNGVLCYGAIGVGGRKMKIHRAAVSRLFESNDQVLDTTAIYRIGQELS